MLNLSIPRLLHPVLVPTTADFCVCASTTSKVPECFFAPERLCRCKQK